MDFKDIIRQLVERVEKLKDSLQSEEATKNALIMPFLNSLGYDVFNPLEVVPEYVCDIGTKHPIERLEDIYNFADSISSTIATYEQ